MSISAVSIEEAHKRIRPYIHQTSVLTSRTLNELMDASIYFKCENFQKIGAFKIRGGMNAALKCSAEERSKGLCTHSSGNHAQAIAYAAKTLGTKAYIVMPENAPAVKVSAVKGYGATVIFCEPNQQARESTLQKVVDDTGAKFIHPYNDEHVIEGQATAAKELLEQTGHLDNIIAPVGGGGLLSGTSLSASYFAPSTKVFGAEPEGAADAVLSFRSGHIEKAPYVTTIADGLMTTLGTITLPLIRQHVKDIYLASEDEIKAALKFVYERMKIVIEPSSAVPLAVLLKHKDLFKGSKTGIIISGGNVDLLKISAWFNELNQTK